MESLTLLSWKTRKLNKRSTGFEKIKSVDFPVFPSNWNFLNFNICRLTRSSWLTLSQRKGITFVTCYARLSRRFHVKRAPIRETYLPLYQLKAAKLTKGRLTAHGNKLPGHIQEASGFTYAIKNWTKIFQSHCSWTSLLVFKLNLVHFIHVFKRVTA